MFRKIRINCFVIIRAYLKVKPAARGLVSYVDPNTGNTISNKTLRWVLSHVLNSGDTILLADGVYTFLEAEPDGNGNFYEYNAQSGSDEYVGSYTELYITKSDITIRSESGDPQKVVLDSEYADHGDLSALIAIPAALILIIQTIGKLAIMYLMEYTVIQAIQVA